MAKGDFLVADDGIYALMKKNLEEAKLGSAADVALAMIELRGVYERELARLRKAAMPALNWIDEIYPRDVFDGSSGDEGAVQIVEIRENLRRALRMGGDYGN